MNAHELQAEFARLHEMGVRLAGPIFQVARRASVYRQLYLHSGRNHVFPLIAAHGALWASGYFAFGLRLAQALSWQYFLRCSRIALATGTTFRIAAARLIRLLPERGTPVV